MHAINPVICFSKSEESKYIVRAVSAAKESSSRLTISDPMASKYFAGIVTKTFKREFDRLESRCQEGASANLKAVK